ncbi:TPA: hypothetical protein QCQ24_004493 [Bacillus cereus]|nr:hypothetical protein [Bacillus cereus]
MNIVIYRSNQPNILLNSMFTERLQKELCADYNISITMEEDKNINLEQIKQANLVIFFSHGDNDRIFHKFTNPFQPYEDLIHHSDVDILKDKKVIVFSCYTALELGPLAEEKGCTVYFGFKGEINRDLPLEILEGDFEFKDGEDPKRFISSVYSEVFYKLIYRAITEDLTFQQFEKMMKLGLDKTIVQKLRAEQNIPFKFHSQGAQPVKDTAKSIAVFGDASTKFIS